MFDYILIRSKRKTIAIYIRNGNLEVHAPLKTLKRDIDEFIMSKEKWITDNLNKSQEIFKEKQKFILNYGDSIIIRGREYPIVSKGGAASGFNGDCVYMPSKLESEQIKAICVQIYINLAKIYLSNRTIEYAELMSVRPSAIKINSAKTRWGSCSSKKSINFSWRLIMADDDVIDYVVVHELAHLIEMNHSKRFWNIVEEALPNYREQQSGLKELGKKLARENWDI